MSRSLKRLSVTFFTFILIYLIYKFSIVLLKIGMDEASKDIFYIFLSLYLGYSLIRYSQYKTSPQIEEIKLYSKVNSIFGTLGDGVTPLQGLNLKSNENKGSIENIVVTSKGVFNIVTCSYTGDIIIKKDENWYKEWKREDRMINSPINKIRENRSFLSNIFEEEEIVDIVLLINDNIEIEGEENFPVPILRNDELKDYIEDYKIEEEYEEEELYQKLYPTIEGEKDIEKMKKNYSKFLDTKWQFRSRLAAVSVFFIFYLLNLIYVY